jgi:hypothetical protein
MDNPTGMPEISMDASQLCREDTYTDSRVGTIRVLTPVKTDGDTDNEREVQYIGSTQIMTPAGALPLSFEIPATSLTDAVDGFGTAAQVAVENTMEELRQMQREQASQIVIPKGGMDPGALGGMGGPGGKIQLP